MPAGSGTDRSYVALELDALSSAQISAAAVAGFTGSAPFTIDAWIRFNGLAANVIAIGQDGVFAFGSQGSSFYFQFAGMPIILSDPTQPQLQDNSWHYICATFDGAMVRLYLDGKFNTGQSCMGQVASSTNPVVLGQGLQGLVRRVRVFNTVLGADAVLDAMFGPPPSGSIVADLDFTVNPAVDRGPSAFPITLLNTARAVRVSPAVSLGTVGFIRPMGEKATNPGGAQVDPYSVQAWIFIASASNPTQAIFVNSGIDLDSGMALYVDYDATAARYRLVSQRGSDLGTGQTLTSSGTIPIGVWTNVATTFDGTTLSLYLNGVLDSTKACPPIPLYNQFSDLVIGAGILNNIASATMTFQGYLREVDVWAIALDAAAVQANMAAAPDTDAPGLSAAYVFTNSPARDQVKGHPIGLAEGALLSGQLGPAPISTSDEESVEAPLPEMGLDPELMAKIRADLDLSAFHAEHKDAFDAAEASDVALFTDPAHRALIADAWRETRRKLVEDPTSLRLLFTRHRIDGDHVLIAHRPTGSYVACRMSADTVDDCTMWKINLVFVVIAGVIDVFFGVSAKLGDKAMTLIRRALANPRIGAQLARGSAMTAGGLFIIVQSFYEMGLLRPLALAVIEVGFWTLIRIIANLLLLAVGTGAAAARTIASLVATATTFILVYSQKPTSCDPLPTVSLGSIAFDHDPTNATVEALTIRRNFAQDVPVPEWTPGRTQPADAPCAYAISAVASATPTVSVALAIPQATSRVIRIRATGGGILGAIDPVTVGFSGTVATVVLPLSHHSLAGGGIQRQDVTWTWQYQVDGGAWTNCVTTNHRVYVILSAPTQPWQQSGPRSNQQLPWAQVLDYACSWAAGATTTDQALQMITTKVNAGINLKYDIRQGASFYTRGSAGGVTNFLCTEFLLFLTSGTGRGPIVNCTDCATIVTSFANILGSNVFASLMDDPAGNGFACNQILAIGYTNWAVPFGRGFSYHEVPWTATGSYPDPMYDACLQYDTGTNPWGTGPHTAGLPVKVTFSAFGASPSPFVPFVPPLTATTYRERLAANTQAGIAACVPRGPRPASNSGRRPVV